MDRSSLSPPVVSLPAPLTSLIGRAREITDICNLQQRDDVRLVTLTGPGGVGKTRTAIAVAARRASDFPGGIRFIDLSALTDPGQVGPEIARQFAIRGTLEPLPQVAAALGSQPWLLVLDNFEQVIEAAPIVANLLALAPQVRMLVTSREPLRISGEWEYPIPPLAVTTPSEPDSPDLDDAILLFLERARTIQPAFALTESNTADVAEICLRLDGLPLAIELAAARVKAFPPSTLLSRLEQRLPLLTAARRDAPARQQTMRDAIAWSYALLTLPEQMLMRRLSVFVGGFSLDAADAVAATNDLSGVDLLRDLSSLVDKSLIRQEHGPDGQARYQMLETIREFALEQLLAGAEHRAIRAAHVAWCTALAEDWRTYGDTRHEPHMAGRPEPALATEYDNVRSALTWLEESGDIPALARLAGTIWWFWLAHGPRAEGKRWLELASSIPADSPYNAVSRLRVMQGRGSLLLNQGQYAESEAAVTECLTLARELGERVAEATAMAMIGFIAICTGDYERAISPIRDSVELNRQIGHWRAEATVRALEAMAYYGLGQYDEAADLLEPSLAVHRESGDTFDLAVALIAQALVRCDQGRHQESAALLAESLPIWHGLKSWENLSEWLADAATLASATGQAETGSRLLGAAYALRDRVGYAFNCPERPRYERTEQALRDQLGSGEFERAARAGSAAELQDTLTEATEFIERLCEPNSASPTRPEDRFGLTARELDVLRLLAQGQSDREIADALYIGRRTAESHVSNVLAKLGTRNRAEAAALATRENLT